MNHVPRRAARASVVLAGVLVGVLAAVAVSGCGGAGGPTPAPPTPGATAVTTPSPAATAVPATPASRAPVATVTAPATGTGDAADRAAAETVFRTYLRAVADGDFATACALNAPETNQRLIDELARQGTPAPTCEAAIASLYAGSGVAEGAASIADTVTVERVDVDGDAATVAWSVEVAGRRPVVNNALRRIDGQWRLLPTPNPAG